MMQKLLIVFAGLALLAGCSTTPTGSTYTHRETFAGPDMDVIPDNLLESAEDRSYQVMLNAVRVREGAWEARYFLEIRYAGASDAGYIEIGPGETLLLTVDGQALRFRGPGSVGNRKVTAQQTYVENAVYEAKPEDLRRIAKAKEVKVQVNGNRRRLYRDFKPENIQRFRSFVLLHMGS